jgi:membrane magnesium transporter 1
MRHG